MPPPLLIDLDEVDLDDVLMDRAAIYEHLPQRHEFELLDGICLLDRERKRIVAFCDVHAEDWWTRGHLPGRPLLPGVLMLEMAGQVAAVAARLLADVKGFIGFGGVDACRFRETVIPPARLYVIGAGAEFRSRRITSKLQGVIDGRVIFEATIIGVTMRD